MRHDVDSMYCMSPMSVRGVNGPGRYVKEQKSSPSPFVPIVTSLASLDCTSPLSETPLLRPSSKARGDDPLTADL